MRARIVAGLAAGGLLIAMLALDGMPGAVSGRANRPLATPAVTLAPPSASPAAQRSPSRNLFAYAPSEPPPTRATPSPVRVMPSAPAIMTPVVSPIRLVGLVTRGGEPRAALAHAGEVVIVGPGDELAGYVVVSVDDDVGVRLRKADGEEMVLAPPQE